VAKAGSKRIAVIGAGPIGLEAAAYARSLEYPVKLYERGRIGEHLTRWGHVRLFTPFGMNSTRIGRAAIVKEGTNHAFPADADCITGRQHVVSYLEPLAKTALLRDVVQTENRVLQVSRSGALKEHPSDTGERGQKPFRLLIRDSKNREYSEEADVVLDCTGTYGQHRWMGAGGIPAPGELGAEQWIAYGLEDILGQRRGVFANKCVLVYGGGYSAATTVCNLSNLAEEHPETWVVWLASSTGSQPIRRIPNDPLRERDRLAAAANMLATRADGNVEFHRQAHIESIEAFGPEKGFRVTAVCETKRRQWDVDRMVANVGYTPDTVLYRELQVHECHRTLAPVLLAQALAKSSINDWLNLTMPGPEFLHNPEPDFYILGAKSFGRNSNFFLRVGFEQIRDVFKLISGRGGLDLYRQESRWH
jgi:hypothetical protein